MNKTLSVVESMKKEKDIIGRKVLALIKSKRSMKIDDLLQIIINLVSIINTLVDHIETHVPKKYR